MAGRACLIHLGSPGGGWYVSLAIVRSAFPTPIATSIDAMALLLHYDAIVAMCGPSGSTICRQALQHARRVADIDTMVLHTHYSPFVPAARLPQMAIAHSWVSHSGRSQPVRTGCGRSRRAAGRGRMAGTNGISSPDVASAASQALARLAVGGRRPVSILDR